MLDLLRELRTARYAPLTALMLVVAAICVAAGTWQIARYDGKHVANDALRRNAHVAAAPVERVLPVLGPGTRTPPPDDVEFRTVTATGRFDGASQLLVRQRQVGDRIGYLVLTPFRTPTATLLVIRGFVASNSAAPTDVSPAPSGQVTVRARAEAAETGPDEFAALHNGQIQRIVPTSAAARLGTPVFDGYVQLEAAQPGTAGLVAMPGPDLSNPAGGAIEPQHLAYIVQWYLFAALALAAPVVMVRTDRKRAQDDAVAATAPAAPVGAAPAAAAPVTRAPAAVASADQRLADRYGRAR